ALDGTPMTGALDAPASMKSGGRLGYRHATAVTSSVLTDAGTAVTGHEFHRSGVTRGADVFSAWSWDGQTEGITTANVHASHLHVHWAGHPQLAQRFTKSAQHYSEDRYG